MRNRLHEKCGKFVNVQILADLLDVRDERWHNAIEGYLGNNKLLLVVEPKYAKTAMEIYQDMDKKKFFRAAVLDTEKVQETEWEVKEGALAQELIAKEPYVQAYINFFLGNVIKCESIEELRQNRIGITADCVLYHSFRLQHINPENYTRRAYIGETSMRQRIRRLEEKCESLQEERIPLQEMLEEIRRISQLEGLTQPLEDYRQWLSDLQKIPAKEAEKARLLDTMQKLREESVLVWEQQKQEIQQKQEAKKAEIEAVQKTIWNHQENGKRFQNMQVDFNEQLVQKENEFRQQDREKYEPEFQEYLEGRQSRNYEYLMRERIKKKQPLEDAQEKAYEKLVEARSAYLRKYPNRTYSATIRDNDVYEKQLSNLECDNLEKYREEAQEQARAAVEHFKVDFVSKIRYAIKEAYQKKDELNRIISRLDFGKDKYQFVITKNKGPDGRFYRMFMDDALDINPSQLSDHMENQMNLFTMEHEEEYGDLMNELIEIFIPPENATREELEEARKRMAELDTMIQNLYESSVKGVLPERQAQRMIQQYDEEQILLERRVQELESQIQQETVKKADTERFLALVRKYRDCTELTDSMLYSFIDRVEVHEATGGRTIYRQQNIDIHFNFIGSYYPPVETVSEEERIAAIDAEQKRKKQEKGRRANERRKQKIEALRLAAEAGDPEAIAQYEQHLSKLRERNQKYRQKVREAREADPEYLRQLDEKERIRQEKLLETERKRIERATRKKKMSRAELREKAKTDPEAAEQWAAMKAKEAEARQRKKEREEARIASDPEYAAMMAERKAEYTRTRTAKRKAEHNALVELARTDPEAARQLAEKRKYQSEATTKSRQKMKAAAEAGDPDGIRRYEAYLAKRREDYHKKNQSKEEISA